jgi:hypothetical protein
LPRPKSRGEVRCVGMAHDFRAGKQDLAVHVLPIDSGRFDYAARHLRRSRDGVVGSRQQYDHRGVEAERPERRQLQLARLRRIGHDTGFHLQFLTTFTKHIPRLLCVGRQLAAKCGRHEIFGVVADRCVLRPDHAPVLQLTQNGPVQREETRVADRREVWHMLGEHGAQYDG